MHFLVLLSALLACAAGVPLNTTKPRLDGRIYDGNQTDITSHPYQVTVLQSGFYKCSGSIISANWVVTTEYCVNWYNLKYISVRSDSTFSFGGGTLHRPTSVITHENINYDNHDYDVALVQVFPAFTFSDTAQPITLQCDPVPAGTDVVVTGWVVASSENQPLQQLPLQITSDSSCNSTYNGDITDRMICAGDPNAVNGVCSDFGSLLVASNRLVGLYSWGSCVLQDPGVYTKVSALCDWIVINAGL